MSPRRCSARADAVRNAAHEFRRMPVAGIALGVVDREVGAGDAAGRHERRDELGELPVIETGAPRRIHRRHHLLVQHVEIHVQPGAVKAALFEPLDHPPGGRSRAAGQHVLDVDARDLGRQDVAVVLHEAGLVPAALADLDRIGIGREHADLGPVGQQRLAAAGRRARDPCRRRRRASAAWRSSSPARSRCARPRAPALARRPGGAPAGSRAARCNRRR